MVNEIKKFLVASYLGYDIYWNVVYITDIMMLTHFFIPNMHKKMKIVKQCIDSWYQEHVT